jgi:hypothetical protein
LALRALKPTFRNEQVYLALTYAQTMDAAAAYRSQITPAQVDYGVASLQPSRFLGEMAPHAPPAQFNLPL